LSQKSSPNIFVRVNFSERNQQLNWWIIPPWYQR